MRNSNRHHRLLRPRRHRPYSDSPAASGASARLLWATAQVPGTTHADLPPGAACAGFPPARSRLYRPAGRYAFRTILPGLYPGRTRHYHVKVQASNRPVLTTQYYFPDEKANLTDEFFHRELVMQVAAADDALRARFDVVLAMR
jgi:hypothetical protein